MTTQTRPDELIRILRPEFVTKAGGVPGGDGAGNFPVFIPVQAAYEINGGFTPLLLHPNTANEGPAVAEVGVGGGNDLNIAGGFVIPSTYNGTLTIYTCWVVTTAGGVGDVDVEVFHRTMTKEVGYWLNSTWTTAYNSDTLTGYSINRIYQDWDVNLVVQAGDFVKLWAGYYGSISTFDKVLKLVGWHIIYN